MQPEFMRKTLSTEYCTGFLIKSLTLFFYQYISFDLSYGIIYLFSCSLFCQYLFLNTFYKFVYVPVFCNWFYFIIDMENSFK